MAMIYGARGKRARGTRAPPVGSGRMPQQARLGAALPMKQEDIPLLWHYTEQTPASKRPQHEFR
ncbi:hypothetical protein [Pseudorhodobacter sp. MZDSW-24AT]|uniref:hypothetical protein n=1 Tax=Pseudorhodobacter sp. MZDSW-24AT TaxID=2052957 RepID=UPI0012FE1815|nr:hypothetical protein [Pseudorhodobacter sp. MZDSW-24AT]